jgi:AraC-like DNA-binding protein
MLRPYSISNALSIFAERSAMQERAEMWCVPHLNGLNLLRANFVTYAFKRHMHDYFVIGVIEEGVQRFAYRGAVHYTPPTGVIVLNPAEAHTGEAAIPTGFRYRALYPEASVLQQIASEIKGRSHDIPFFPEPVIHDAPLYGEICGLHVALETATTPLEHESRYLWALAQIMVRHADAGVRAQPVRRERSATERLRRYIDEHYADDIRLADLANRVSWSPFYLLRVFRKEVGLPPHAYLENVRIREAQRLLKSGLPIVQVAYETGFSSQSHFTTTFKSLIGVTPGQYARQVNFLKDSGVPPELS